MSGGNSTGGGMGGANFTMSANMTGGGGGAPGSSSSSTNTSDYTALCEPLPILSARLVLTDTSQPEPTPLRRPASSTLRSTTREPSCVECGSLTRMDLRPCTRLFPAGVSSPARGGGVAEIGRAHV